MTMTVQANELTPQTPGQLQCASKAEAKQFSCRFSARACTCSTGSFKASCTCPEGKISSYLQRNTLPFTSKNIVIEKHGDTIAARTQVGSAIHVHATMENVKITTIQNHGECSITTSVLEGCYSCIFGAKATIVCYSTQDQTTADITCEGQHQLAICTPRGRLSVLSFHFNSPKIATNCTVSCPGGQSHFLINGTLDYVRNSELQREIGINDDISTIPPDNVWHSVTEWVSSIPRNFTFFGLIRTFIAACVAMLLISLTISIVNFFSNTFPAKKQI
ncbi:hypothetical protein COOONC_22373 [Cooperia oncophora]